jgi:hypothetical protein
MTYQRVTGEYIPFTCTVGEDLSQAACKFAFWGAAPEVIKEPVVAGNVMSVALLPAETQTPGIYHFEFRVSSDGKPDSVAYGTIILADRSQGLKEMR